MAQEPVVIPEKIYFKIGEVCELVGVQAHVLRYWETEFSMLSPQKNKSGQRSYRRRDVEIALRIKQLLYNEMFTIAGAKKKLQSERESSKAKSAPVAPQPSEATPAPSSTPSFHKAQSSGSPEAPTLFDIGFASEVPVEVPGEPSINSGDGRAGRTPAKFDGDQREVIRTLATHLLELREMLKTSRIP
jgi:DNA-binding transcriptional MerR regulator